MTEEQNVGDRIHLEGLEVSAQIGVTDQERSAPQRLAFNITLWPTPPQAGLQDDLARTVDYAAVAAETKRFVETRSDRLIETLADALAKRLLDQFRIRRVKIELRKFVLPETKFVSVVLTRDSAPK